jgi:hypothetical protein
MNPFSAKLPDNFSGKAYIACALWAVVFYPNRLAWVGLIVAFAMIGWETYLFVQRYKHDHAPFTKTTKQPRHLCVCYLEGAETGIHRGVRQRRENLNGRILRIKEKHATRYFDASTVEKLHAVALAIVKERLKPDYAFITHPGEPSEWYDVKADLTDEQIAALPTEKLQQSAGSERSQCRRYRGEYTEALEVFEKARRAVKQKDGALAWEVLQDRSDHEYEGHSFEYLENV